MSAENAMLVWRLTRRQIPCRECRKAIIQALWVDASNETNRTCDACVAKTEGCPEIEIRLIGIATARVGRRESRDQSAK